MSWILVSAVGGESKAPYVDMDIISSRVETPEPLQRQPRCQLKHPEARQEECRVLKYLSRARLPSLFLMRERSSSLSLMYAHAIHACSLCSSARARLGPSITCLSPVDPPVSHPLPCLCALSLSLSLSLSARLPRAFLFRASYPRSASRRGEAKTSARYAKIIAGPPPALLCFYLLPLHALVPIRCL